MELIKDAAQIFLLYPNPFTMAERLGIETQVVEKSGHGENDETDVDQV
jgi:hypothetical protein